VGGITHPWVSSVPRVLYDTAPCTVRYRCVPDTGMVVAGLGMVWQLPTLSIPVIKPTVVSHNHKARQTTGLRLPQGSWRRKGKWERRGNEKGGERGGR
jgi:hypothetical protein